MAGSHVKPGRVYDLSTTDLLLSYLYGFRVNSSRLKKAHKDWLREQFHETAKHGVTTHKTNRASTHYWWIGLMGTASRTGNWRRNLTLSRLRAKAVNQYLNDLFGTEFRFQINTAWIGDFGAKARQAKAPENPLDRAVLIAMKLLASRSAAPPKPIHRPDIEWPQVDWPNGTQDDDLDDWPGTRRPPKLPFWERKRKPKDILDHARDLLDRLRDEGNNPSLKDRLDDLLFRIDSLMAALKFGTVMVFFVFVGGKLVLLSAKELGGLAAGALEAKIIHHLLTSGELDDLEGLFSELTYYTEDPDVLSTLNLSDDPVEIRLRQGDYESALKQVFPGDFLKPVSRAIDKIGRDAARQVVQSPRFIEALQDDNMKLAGTLFHSAAKDAAGRVPANALPTGWTLSAERTIQSGKGGSRLDLLLQGPGGELVEIDWKTTGGSALSSKTRKQMRRHAGQILVNVAGRLIEQSSRSWVDYVRPLLPTIDW